MNDRIVMTFTMIAETEGFLCASLFMKSPHWFFRVSVYFYRPIIDLGECLNFNIISPYSIYTFADYIVLDISSLNKIFVVIFLIQNIVHAFFSNHPMKILIAISLMCNRSEHAISISTNFHNFEMFCSQFICKSDFLSSPIYGRVIKRCLLFGVELNPPCATVHLPLWL
jgi:hypothetical protein